MLHHSNPPLTSYDGNWQAGADYQPYGAGSYAPTSYAPKSHLSTERPPGRFLLSA